jgi:hypothetical protein
MAIQTASYRIGVNAYIDMSDLNQLTVAAEVARKMQGIVDELRSMGITVETDSGSARTKTVEAAKGMTPAFERQH